MTEKLQSAPALGDSAPLAGLGVGARVERVLMVTGVERRESSRGSFTTLSLGDRTGGMASAPFWSDDRLPQGVSRGDIVRVAGSVTEYAGRRQLKVTTLESAPDEPADPRRWLPAVADVLPLWKRLDGRRAEIRTDRLRRLAGLFYDDAEFRSRYELCPGSTAGHHAELGGLLRHTCEVIEIAHTIALLCRADLDLVIVGALLHDVGKLEAYEWHPCFAITEAGSLVGHVVLGAMMVARKLEAVSRTMANASERTVLLHLILSHHGLLEHGSPVRPMTLESEVLHYADDASARTCSMAAALSDGDNFERATNVSRPIWQLDRRRVYRGNGNRARADETEAGGIQNGTAV